MSDEPDLKHVECKHCRKPTNMMDEHCIISKNGIYVVISCEHCFLPLIVQIVNKDGRIDPRVL